MKVVIYENESFYPTYGIRKAGEDTVEKFVVDINPELFKEWEETRRKFRSIQSKLLRLRERNKKC